MPHLSEGSSFSDEEVNRQGDAATEVRAALTPPASCGMLQLKASSSSLAFGPPEGLKPAVIYRMYRGATGTCGGVPHRCWVNFSSSQLCWAPFDREAREEDRVSLREISRCSWSSQSGSEKSPTPSFESCHSLNSSCSDLSGATNGAIGVATRREGLESSSDNPVRVSVFAPRGRSETSRSNLLGEVEVLQMVGSASELVGFASSLQQLIDNRDEEGPQGLDFIQKRLFQYLWKHQGESKTELALFEAQAVLAFNLEPKAGVAYIRSRLNKTSDEDLGRWLAEMSTQKGALDPTMLGNYFSRKDTLEVFRAFVHCFHFESLDLLAAIRTLFDAFKPGGEGQVITRILELFSEAYFAKQPEVSKTSVSASSAHFKDADSVLSVAVSLIMLNTTLHVASRKLGKQAAQSAYMALHEYVRMVRDAVGADQVPDAVLARWYSAIKDSEISIQPLGRASFSKLPVQPDIEGWLVLALSPSDQKRYWAVLALQRLYLFADADDVEPFETLDLKDKRVHPVTADAKSRSSFAMDLQGKRCLIGCVPTPTASARRSRGIVGSLVAEEAMARAFEVKSCNNSPVRDATRSMKSRQRVALVAESSDLMSRWVNLITSGPY
mmetsp:Transcript_43330/g.92759  ORF Transcript_43330/g.92759 Transcript_43330/m.92759 type:complete len:610 (-) Transcript_43330:78-1907(-)